MTSNSKGGHGMANDGHVPVQKGHQPSPTRSVAQPQVGHQSNTGQAGRSTGTPPNSGGSGKK